MQLQQRNKYLETTVQTASPAQLLIMLYDGAIRFCRQGIEAIEQQRPSDANTYLLKTQDIISEFIITLDRSNPMSEQLLSLYEYFNQRLVEANTKKSAEPAREVLQHLIELKETWMQAAKQTNAQAGHANGNGSSPKAYQSTVV
ncbi:flagellar export chaperone FliS [Paenibacillus sp. J5C_2022]|uniref:flagellar export chaperone FliS n=1 Tax=Paenibacillus sp. J5C2022 TaxID=2977129 RepID=UPI0021D11958|nr:flagellar export chaperone FliS [Paenibacillus sp. J5C2022]MCU6708436.1 flagellar export chaperone FliS [Paenibacillus sp. J5C2022]